MQELTAETAGRVTDRLGPLIHRFAYVDHAAAVLQPDSDLHVVTGFGPTNAPTAGTLSVMLGAVELQRQLDAPMTVVISELGAWNSRNVAWTQLEAVRDQMTAFLEALGFDTTRGRIRSHLDHANLARTGKIARFLSRRDLLQHSEEYTELYDSHGLLGSDIGITIDSLYTVADILGPAELGTQNILMVSGAEEAYFTGLARLVLARQKAAGDLSLGWDAEIGALYFRVLEGLSGYPKMSKSIPASSIHLGMEEDELAARIMDETPASQPALLSAIALASGWGEADRAAAQAAFRARTDTPTTWYETRRAFLDTFTGFRQMWAKCAR